MIDLSKYQDQINEIASFAKNSGFSFIGATKEQVDEFMKKWLHNGKQFSDCMRNADWIQKQSLLKPHFKGIINL